MSNPAPEQPPEVVTLLYCHGCERLSPAGDAQTYKSDPDSLSCPRCGTKLAADSFHDYADLEVADYE